MFICDTECQYRYEVSLSNTKLYKLSFQIVFQTKMINLEFAAKMLIGDPDVDKTATAKFKSKYKGNLSVSEVNITI